MSDERVEGRALDAAVYWITYAGDREDQAIAATIANNEHPAYSTDLNVTWEAVAAMRPAQLSLRAYGYAVSASWDGGTTESDGPPALAICLAMVEKHREWLKAKLAAIRHVDGQDPR